MSAEFIEPIRRLPSAESAMNIRRIPSAELGTAKEWIIPADRLFNKLTYSNLMLISAIDNPVKRAFYEMETIRGEGGNLAASKIRNLECPSYEICLIV